MPTRAVVAEAVGTCLLVAAIVGAGIMGTTMTGGNPALALLTASIGTGGALLALISAFAPVSGAHFNPVVTLAAAAAGDFKWNQVPHYIGAQIIGAVGGAVLANLMFGHDAIEVSQTARSGFGLLLGEAVATFGLLAAVRGSRPDAIPFAVAFWITGAFWFSSSSSFANPAAAIGRAFTDTFCGIQPADLPGFIAAEGVGAALAYALFRWFGLKPHKSKA
jgi:glycerol uptake facilitator-like aquaporin